MNNIQVTGLTAEATDLAEKIQDEACALIESEMLENKELKWQDCMNTYLTIRIAQLQIDLQKLKQTTHE